ncbi:GSCOCG00000733001-RA-CDS [Cotesia congregata]|uniref:Nucleoside diphosphate-linked moiety X motif 6 n=1 Tax=Cotesia congregata TaxID=51543 RepID=A0A8J2H9G4_COTCN|nr:GSCOCG00000733001-RA-CDS [Cotesia congregata]CAG5087013.1 Similar to NUDT8: Nudix hydrolase 8 (Arabidopsis thaliana) [Cotesia congregata]
MAAILSRTIRLTWTLNCKILATDFASDNLIKAMESTSCFIGKEDNHNGILVDSTKEPCSADDVVNRLRASLTDWSKNNKKTVWFRVERNDADWIPLLVKEGFLFHHVKEQFVTLYRCLTSDKNIPPYAHTNLGVGGFVINDKTNEVLVIKENYSNKAANRATRWKLPGGYVEPGENIPEAVEREVFEETGIKAKFKSLVGFRHAHNYAFGCSDIYFVARLVPETLQINKCTQEIAEAVWMKLEDYANSPDVYRLNRFIAKKMIELLNSNTEIGLVNGERPNSTEPIWIYVITNQDDKKDLSPVRN